MDSLDSLVDSRHWTVWTVDSGRGGKAVTTCLRNGTITTEFRSKFAWLVLIRVLDVTIYKLHLSRHFGSARRRTGESKTEEKVLTSEIGTTRVIRRNMGDVKEFV